MRHAREMPDMSARQARPAPHGNHFAAASGAITREPMHRMGHASMRAALIYQHATAERDARIALTLDRVYSGQDVS